MEKECLFCFTVLEPRQEKKYVCEECERKIKILKQVTKVDEAERKMTKIALKNKRKSISFDKERNLILRKIISGKCDFNSVSEICFAMSLEKEKIVYYPNFKVGNYKVDFLLPQIKKIVEIDGELYHTDDNKEFFRERAIMQSVGNDYEIVRINAKEVPQKTFEGIKDILDFIVSRRNYEKNFRDTRYDEMYLQEYYELHKYLREKRYDY